MITADAQTDPYMLIQQIESSQNSMETSALIDKLVDLNQASVSALLEKTPKLIHSRLHSISATVFARIGYPQNKEALDFMVSDVSNINSRTYEISRSALLSAGAPVLPSIVQALEFYRRDDNFYKSEIESLEEIESLIQK